MTELDQLIVLIKRFEGCRLKAYLCPAGVWTIGWGSTGGMVLPGTVWSQEHADARLLRDAKNFLVGAMRLCPGVTAGQIVAAADFAYNLGLGRLKISTFRKMLIEKNYDEAKVQLMKWVRANGKVLNGLVIRRKAECDLF